MRNKYLVNYKGITRKLTTKQQIMDLFNVPLYIINKIIRKSNDSKFQIKKKLHNVYNDFFNEVDIYLIKPELNDSFQNIH